MKGSMSRVEERSGSASSEEEEEFDPEDAEYASPPQRKHERQKAAAGGCGLGVTLKQNAEGNYYVTRMERGGPCDVSGQVKHGDILESVGGYKVKGIPYPELAALVLGEEGSEAVLVLRDDLLREVRNVRVRRFPIDPAMLRENERQQKEKKERIAAEQLAREEEMRCRDCPPEPLKPCAPAPVLIHALPLDLCMPGDKSLPVGMLGTLVIPARLYC